MSIFLNSGCLADSILDVYADNYLNWLIAVRMQKPAESVHRYHGGLTAAESILNKVIGPNLAGQLIAQRRSFIDKNYNDLI